MLNKFLLLLTIAVGCICSLKTVKINNADWHYIGYVDGKVFMASTSVRMSWFEAVEYCKANQMQLATITSVAQKDVLKDAYDSIGFNAYLWTSARDSMTLRQYSWDSTNQQPLDSVVYFVSQNAIINSCLWLGVSPSETTVRLFPSKCSDELFVLCEEKVSKEALSY